MHIKTECAPWRLWKCIQTIETEAQRKKLQLQRNVDNAVNTYTDINLPMFFTFRKQKTKKFTFAHTEKKKEENGKHIHAVTKTKLVSFVVVFVF